MTLSTTQNTKSYTGDNSTTEFAFPNLFFSDAHLVVTVDGEVKTITTDYTVSGEGDEAGGAVTFTTAPTSGAAVIIQRIVPLTQETDLENFDGNPADVTEKQFDLLAMSDQQIEEKTERSILAPVGSVLATSTIIGTIDATAKVLTISTAGPVVSQISDISTSLDATFVGLADGDYIRYNGSEWVNATLAEVQAEIGSDGLIIVSNNDTTAGTLEDKLLVGTGFSLSTQNDGANETRTIDLAYALQIEAENGTNTTKPMSPFLTRKALEAYDGFLTPAAESPEFTPATNTSHTFTHGLGRKPHMTRVVLRCVIANNGYAIGDEIHAWDRVFTTGADRATTVKENATECVVAVRDLPSLSNESGGGTFVVTSSWRWVIYAW